MKKRDKHDSIVKINPDKHPKLYTTLRWLENQWFHNKAAILCVAFFSFVIIFGFSQCLAKKEPDYKILLCLDNYLPSEVRAAMEIYTAQYGEDLNGDGEVLVHILDCTNGTDRDQNYANMTTLLSELQLGEAVIIIADEHYYEALTQDGNIFDTDQENSEMIALIDDTYTHGFDRRKDISDTIYNFDGYPHGYYSSSYNAGYGSTALRAEQYRDAGIKAYQFMIENSMS
ncbi:MAG: hypothetical protein IIU66_07975 [Clostridia bacterium]|nr:hypothetical protein [Clostridia bacterium]MBQ5889944.1 hypothetical protein [Clostridia bacterium]